MLPMAAFLCANKDILYKIRKSNPCPAPFEEFVKMLRGLNIILAVFLISSKRNQEAAWRLSGQLATSWNTFQDITIPYQRGETLQNWLWKHSSRMEGDDPAVD